MFFYVFFQRYFMFTELFRQDSLSTRFWSFSSHNHQCFSDFFFPYLSGFYFLLLSCYFERKKAFFSCKRLSLSRNGHIHPLLKKYEMPNKSIQSCFNHMTAHMNETISVVNDDIINGKTQTVYNTISPCIDIESYPVCEDYCQWHAKVKKTLSREEILTLLG